MSIIIIITIFFLQEKKMNYYAKIKHLILFQIQQKNKRNWIKKQR
jgi:hypothetical protein